MQKGRVLRHRCNNRPCHRYVSPHHGHIVFTNAWGSASAPLKDQASVLVCIPAGANRPTIRKLLSHINHKHVGRILSRLTSARMQFVEKVEKNISFGGTAEWVDCEADEAVFRKLTDTDEPDVAKNTCWEQWAGVVQRGSPHTLVLFKTNATRTCQRAPGPGAIKRIDWAPFARTHLQNRNVILHTDKAKAYAMKIPGLLHDSVRHGKKRVKVGGKWVWKKPVYTKLRLHKLPDGRKVRVKAGTQIIDRAWRFILAHMVGVSAPPGSRTLAAVVRSAQWLYWNRGRDLWKETGAMLKELRS